MDALMARRLNTLRLPSVIPEDSQYESDKENDEPVPPTRAEVAAADAALKRMEAALRVSQAVKKPTKSERVARDVARAMAAHARRPSAGGEDVSETPRWSDDDAAGRALNEIDDNWRDDPVLNSGRARRRTLGGRRPRRIVPPVPIVSPPPSTERLLRARDRMVQARKRLHQCSPGRSLCEDLGCGCASNEAAPMVGLCAADAAECTIS